MVDTTQFFDNPATHMCSVLSQAFVVVREHGKTFMILAALQSLAILPLFLVFGSAAYALFASIANRSPGHNDLDMRSLFKSMGLFVGYLVASICVGAGFHGAFARVVSEVVARHDPNWRACLEKGREKMCPIIGFGILCMVAVAAWFLVTLLLLGEDFSLWCVAVMTLLSVYVCVIGSALGIPSIVVENQSSHAAFQRSRGLISLMIRPYRHDLLYASEIFFYLAVNGLVKATALYHQWKDVDTFAVMIVASWLIWMLLAPLNAILGPLIYLSLRIRLEGLGMERLRWELLLMDDSIELQPGGIDSGVPVTEDPSLMSIAEGVVV